MLCALCVVSCVLQVVRCVLFVVSCHLVIDRCAVFVVCWLLNVFDSCHLLFSVSCVVVVLCCV